MTIQKRDTIIFDLDGTLVDSAPDLHACANRLLSKYNQPSISIKESQSFIGDGVRNFVKSAWCKSNAKINEDRLTQLEVEFLGACDKSQMIQIKEGKEISFSTAI